MKECDPVRKDEFQQGVSARAPDKHSHNSTVQAFGKISLRKHTPTLIDCCQVTMEMISIFYSFFLLTVISHKSLEVFWCRVSVTVTEGVSSVNAFS